MLAFSLRGWNIPYPEYVVPLAAGLAVGGVVVLIIHLFFRPRPAPAGPPQPAEKKDPEYDPFVQGSAGEMRKAYRRSGNPIEVFVSQGDKKNPLRGWVVDRSVGGMCLELATQVSPEVILELLPVHAPPMTPWIDVEVRSCRSTHDGWQIGCQFVRQPPWSIMLLFG